jgi:hypothetical protein
MKFNADRHFTYIMAHVDKHKQQLHSYYKMTKYDLEEITKEWSVDLLVVVDPAKMSDEDSPEAMLDTPRPRKTKKDVEELGGTEVEQSKGKVTPTRDKADPSKKRKTTPSRTSSRKKTMATQTRLKTTLAPDDFDFLIAH